MPGQRRQLIPLARDALQRHLSPVAWDHQLRCQIDDPVQRPRPAEGEAVLQRGGTTLLDQVPGERHAQLRQVDY